LRFGSAGPLGYQLIMLDSSVLREIEHRLFVVATDLEIAARSKDLVAIRRCQRHNFTRR
jgi:hypothetical protein